MNLFIFKLNSLGDNVVFVPVVQALRLRFPEWRITLLTTPNESELYNGPLGPHAMIRTGKLRFNAAYRRPWELARWMWRIRQMRPDACLVAYDQSNVAHLVAKHCGASVRIGGNLVRIRVKRSLTEVIAPPEDARPLTWNWRMGGAFAQAIDPSVDWPDAPPPPDLRHLLADGPEPTGRRTRIAIHPGAGGWLNQWSEEKFSKVASALARDFEVVWIHRKGSQGPRPAGTIIAEVESISQLAQWLASSRLFLGNNSGPMHLANALGCYGVAVTGPTSRGWDPYWHRDRWTVLRHPSLACAPCENTTVALTGCANLATPMACLKYWSEDMVEAACRKQLERISSASP